MKKRKYNGHLQTGREREREIQQTAASCKMTPLGLQLLGFAKFKVPAPERFAGRKIPIKIVYPALGRVSKD